MVSGCQPETARRKNIGGGIIFQFNASTDLEAENMIGNKRFPGSGAIRITRIRDLIVMMMYWAIHESAAALVKVKISNYARIMAPGGYSSGI